MGDSSGQAMGDSMGPMQDPEGGGRMNGQANRIGNKGRGRNRGKDNKFPARTESTTVMPMSPSGERTTMNPMHNFDSNGMSPMPSSHPNHPIPSDNNPDHPMPNDNNPDHPMQNDNNPDHPMPIEHKPETPTPSGNKPAHKSTDDMMQMKSTTTPMPKTTSTSAAPSMNMFPDLNTVEELQRKQAEEHEKIIAVYKSFKDWVDYLRTNIKGGTLNPLLTRRILEDIRAYQQIILSPHPHKPYNPPKPCDPYRDVWCPEVPLMPVLPHVPSYPEPKTYRKNVQRHGSKPTSSLVIL